MSSFSESASNFIYLKPNLCNEIASNICQLVSDAKTRIARVPTTTFEYSSSLPVLNIHFSGWVGDKINTETLPLSLSFPIPLHYPECDAQTLTSLPFKMINVRSDPKPFVSKSKGPRVTLSQVSDTVQASSA